MKKETIVFTRQRYEAPQCFMTYLQAEKSVLFSGAGGQDSEFEDEDWGDDPSNQG